ncbi:MAG: hypothetical protein AAF740_03115 [Bacteroidota bacterium]
MKYSFFIPLMSLITSLSLGGCNDDENCRYTEIALLERLEVMGDTVKINTSRSLSLSVGEPLPIDVFYLVQNRCGSFKNFRRDELNISTELIYNGCVCNEIVQIEAARFDFDSSEAGNYTLNFTSDNGDAILLNISIQ